MCGAVRPDGRQAGDADPAAVARGTALPEIPPLAEGLDLAVWAERSAPATGVPARALEAYGTAERAQRAATPDCGLSWATLAGVGRVESDHGRLGRADLDADGVARPSIVGVALDGSPGLAEIPDTDGGRLDGDVEFDRAVGPDAVPARHLGALRRRRRRRRRPQPDDLDDAAAAAARYLCATAGHGRRRRLVGRRARLQPLDRLRRRVWTAADRYATALA